MFRFLLLSVLAVSIQAVEVDSKLPKILEKCLEESTASREQLLKDWNEIDVPEDNHAFKKLLSCVFTDAGFVEGENLNMEKINSSLKKMDVDKCISLTKPSELDLHMLQVRNCIVKEQAKAVRLEGR